MKTTTDLTLTGRQTAQSVTGVCHQVLRRNRPICAALGAIIALGGCVMGAEFEPTESTATDSQALVVDPQICPTSGHTPDAPFTAVPMAVAGEIIQGGFSSASSQSHYNNSIGGLSRERTFSAYIGKGPSGLGPKRAVGVVNDSAGNIVAGPIDLAIDSFGANRSVGFHQESAVATLGSVDDRVAVVWEGGFPYGGGDIVSSTFVINPDGSFVPSRHRIVNSGQKGFQSAPDAEFLRDGSYRYVVSWADITAGNYEMAICDHTGCTAEIPLQIGANGSVQTGVARIDTSFDTLMGGNTIAITYEVMTAQDWDIYLELWSETESGWVPLLAPVPVATSVGINDRWPDVATLCNGEFVVTWQHRDHTSEEAVPIARLRSYSPDGAVELPLIQLPGDTHWYPRITEYGTANDSECQFTVGLSTRSGCGAWIMALIDMNDAGDVLDTHYLERVSHPAGGVPLANLDLTATQCSTRAASYVRDAGGSTPNDLRISY